MMQAVAAQVSDGFGFNRVSALAGNLENDVSFEVSHLERMVAEGLRNLHVACRQMEQVESELQQFLQEYYAQVGAFFEELERLHREIDSYDREIVQATQSRRRSASARREDAVLQALREELPVLPERFAAGSWEQEMKSIYHRLVKLYHPDIQPDNRYSTKVLQLINAAYAKRSIWAMRTIEHSLVEHAMARQDTPERKLNRLRERFEAIAESVARASSRKRWLEATEAWQLKRRMEQDRYLVEVIIHRAKQQIEEARRTLARKKIEYRAAIA